MKMTRKESAHFDISFRFLIFGEILNLLRSVATKPAFHKQLGTALLCLLPNQYKLLLLIQFEASSPNFLDKTVDRLSVR
jgi:hypothetical protein